MNKKKIHKDLGKSADNYNTREVFRNFAQISSAEGKESGQPVAPRTDFFYEYDVNSDTGSFYGNIDIYLGYPLCETPRTTEEWHMFIHPEDLKKVIKLRKRCRDSGETFCETYRVKGKDGEYQYFEEHSVPVDFAGKKPTKFVGTCSCSTRRIQDSTSLKERLRFEAFISDLSATFVNLPADKVDVEIERKLKYLIEYMDLDRASLLQFSKDRTKIYLKYSYSIPDPNLKIIREITKRELEQEEQYPWSERCPYFTKKLRQGETVIFRTEDLPDEASLEKEFCKKSGVKSFLLIPVTVGGLVAFTITFGSYRYVLSWPGELIQRLRLVGEIFANALQRKNAEQELKKAYYEIKKLKNQVEAERNYLQEEIKLEHNFEEIIGKSDVLKYILFKVEQVAPTETTVLIMGETGTGKELVVRAIHNRSRLKDRPLVKVNCATLPSNIIESELFGHEKGAFTGAQAERAGRFELADGATIFLDEIGELPLDLQPKLLRVIQEGEFERLGSSRTIKVNVRIIAATNRNLEEEIQNGRFRQDLYYRLNVFPISIPPIRKREEDIPLLLNHFVNKFCKKLGKQTKAISQDTIKALQQYNWPGNVRELENLVERAIIVSQGPKLQFDLQPRANKLDYQPKRLQDFEREHIILVLEEADWKISGKNGAASVLDINPSTLRSRMKKLGIKKPVDFSRK